MTEKDNGFSCSLIPPNQFIPFQFSVIFMIHSIEKSVFSVLYFVQVQALLSLSLFL